MKPLGCRATVESSSSSVLIVLAQQSATNHISDRPRDRGENRDERADSVKHAQGHSLRPVLVSNDTQEEHQETNERGERDAQPWKMSNSPKLHGVRSAVYAKDSRPSNRTIMTVVLSLPPSMRARATRRHVASAGE